MKNRKLSIVEISEELSVPYGTVKHLCHQFKSGVDLQPKYKNCGRKSPLSHGPAKDRALELRQQHLQRLFRKKEVYVPRNRNCQEPIGRSTAAHNIWEVDAKERFHLLDGRPACYLTVTDEKTGAWLEAPVFPL